MPFEPSKSSQMKSAGSVTNFSISMTEKGMAHFAGTSGTADKCRHCDFFQKSKCEKYQSLTGDKKKKITGDAYACSHFKAKA